LPVAIISHCGKIPAKKLFEMISTAEELCRVYIKIGPCLGIACDGEPT